MNSDHIKRIKVLERSLENLLDSAKTVKKDQVKNIRCFLRTEYKVYSRLIKNSNLEDTKLIEIRKNYLSAIRNLYQNT